MDPAVTEWSVRTAGAVECGPLHRLNHSAYVKGLYVFHPISCSKQRQKKKNFFFVSFNDYFSAAFGDAHRISAEEIRN
jgi:hypothetical protein